MSNDTIQLPLKNISLFLPIFFFLGYQRQEGCGDRGKEKFFYYNSYIIIIWDYYNFAINFKNKKKKSMFSSWQPIVAVIVVVAAVFFNFYIVLRNFWSLISKSPFFFFAFCFLLLKVSSLFLSIKKAKEEMVF